MKSALVGLFAFLLSYLLYQLNHIYKIDQQKRIHSQILFQSTTAFSRELGSIEDIIKLLAKSENLQVLGSPNANNNVASYFKDFASVSDNIHQIRWLNTAGQEVVRIDVNDSNTQIRKNEALQNKSSRYYFERSMKAKAGEVYFSPLDLNVEGNQVEIPYNPTVRATLRTTQASHGFDGVLVINYRMGPLLEAIRTFSTDSSTLYIANHDGYWILNPDIRAEWGFMLNMPNKKLSQTDPLLWSEISSNGAVGEFHGESAYFNFSELTLFDNLSKQNQGNNLTFYVKTSNHYFNTTTDVIVAGLFFIICVALGAFINFREFRFQTSLVKLSNALSKERTQLKLVNTSLEAHISQQQLLQDELVEARKLASLGLMVSGVAHELNTPVGGAIMALSNAQNAQIKLSKGVNFGITKGDYEASLHIIDNNLQIADANIKKAIGRIKKFERLAIDRIKEECIECSLLSVVQDSVSTMEPRLRKQKIVLHLQIDDELTFFGPVSTVSQIIENLVLNALNHGFKGQENGNIWIVGKSIRDDIEIRVADDGIGIPKDIQHNIFEPFVTSARSEGNIGLGLYMVQQWTTNLLNGNLSFQSETNVDNAYTTVFRITFPIKL